MNKKNLLTIGEMSKLTGAGIKALRYYERVGILPPAYIEPNSGYRYYSIDQIYIVDIITFCVELDIPLKELTIPNEDFLTRGKEIAQKKIQSLQKGLCLIQEIEQKTQYKPGIYTQEIPQKTFYVKPCGGSIKNLNKVEIVREFLDIQYSDALTYPESGILCKHTPKATEYYAFIEVPVTRKDLMQIPAGTYHCIQTKESQIENPHEVFKNHLAGKNSYLAIEVENSFKPQHELRIIAF
ncbi:MAG: MerR family DNA-binding transcriptional regulator [Defluviitaleaceae bacterium]|nr:MerR family DNA-binding transcriptional regulator [Defluviitaleaceae bacterium]